MPQAAGIRRWTQFSLRTLLVYVTLVACVLAYYLNWIRHRREFILRQNAAYMAAYAEAILNTTGEPLSDAELHSDPSIVRYADRDVRGPGFLQLFGERPVFLFNVMIQVDESSTLLPESLAELRLAQRLFPEALLYPLCVDYDKRSVDSKLLIWRVNDLDSVLDPKNRWWMYPK